MRITIIAMLVLLLFTACSSYTVEEAGKELFESTILSIKESDKSLSEARMAAIRKKCEDNNIDYLDALKFEIKLLKKRADQMK